MNTPFVFGKIVSSLDFTDREIETQHLCTNFLSGINTILISPRRWGKSSLVAKAVLEATKKNKKLRFCFIDLFNVKTEEEFYRQLAQEVMKATASKWEETLELSKKFLGKFIPKLTYSPDPNSEFVLALDWEEVKKQPDEILNLVERIAESKGYKIIVCIDEFQNVSAFDNPLAFQKKMRSHWQKHKQTSYCLYGSRRHMMMDVFTNTTMPFYKFGDLVFLQKIAEQDWVKFIVKRFAETGKKINENDALHIAKLTDNHPYYTQQLAQQTWLRTHKACNIAIVDEAHEAITMQLSMLFQSITDSLSATQINYLRAVIDGVHQLSSREILHKYHLSTSANVLRLKQALLNKDIIDIQNKKIEILDPYYSYWLRKYFFTTSF